jgi:glycosyltransferase involved in cell wall biosynthesis
VSEHLPSVTVIIAARPDQAVVQAADAARQFDYPADRLDILIARGKHPSVQRNVAMKAARGDWIYFLDDDSLAPPGNLRRALSHLEDASVRIVGGPNLCPPEAPPFEQMFALVLSSFAFGPSRARYAAVGEVRSTGEKELILCNLFAHRGTMLELGGFNEALYPNEENALMDRLQQGGGKLIYDPQFLVYRRPRRTLGSFLRMLMTYGRGRAEQVRVNPTFGSALNFVPPAFCLYLLACIAFMFFPLSRENNWWKIVAALPLLVYILVVLAQAIVWMPGSGIGRNLAAVPLLAASPVIYGLGFWRGLFTRLNRGETFPASEVVLQKIER